MSVSDAIGISIDVEWAHPVVLHDLCGLIDQRGLRSTFFCTHDGIEVGPHERGIHPNFRGDGDCLKKLVRQHGPEVLSRTPQVYSFVVEHFKAFAPEARGVRGHSLHYDSQLLSIYGAHGIAYDSSYQMPLEPGLKPFWKECGIVELPIFYNDYFDLRTNASRFEVDRLRLGEEGLKILNVHPNIIYTNAPDLDFYVAAKADYHDPDALLRRRHGGRGARDLFVDILESIAAGPREVLTLGDIDARWREANPDPWPC